MIRTRTVASGSNEPSGDSGSGSSETGTFRPSYHRRTSDLKGRVEVLKVHAKDVRMDETVDLEEIALATSGAVGSDLANMINEAAINAVKHGRNAVSQKDLFEAVEVVLVGKEKKDRIMSQEERRIVSYHE